MFVHEYLRICSKKIQKVFNYIIRALGMLIHEKNRMSNDSCPFIFKITACDMSGKKLIYIYFVYRLA